MRKAAPGVAKHETSLLHPAFARTAACDDEKSSTSRSARDDESMDGIAGIVLTPQIGVSNENHVEAAGWIKEAGSKSQIKSECAPGLTDEMD